MSNGNHRSAPALSDRDTFAANYRIGHVLGKGGFGTVYAGVRVRDNAPVAIKHVAKSAVTAWGQVSSRVAVLRVSAWALVRRGGKRYATGGLVSSAKRNAPRDAPAVHGHVTRLPVALCGVSISGRDRKARRE